MHGAELIQPHFPLVPVPTSQCRAQTCTTLLTLQVRRLGQHVRLALLDPGILRARAWLSGARCRNQRSPNT